MRELYLFLCQVALGCMCIFTGRARGRTHMHIFFLYHTQTRIREDNVCKCKYKTSDSGMLGRRWPQKTIMFVRGHNSSQNQRTKDALTAGLRVHKMANAVNRWHLLQATSALWKLMNLPAFAGWDFGPGSLVNKMSLRSCCEQPGRSPSASWKPPGLTTVRVADHPIKGSST